MSDKYDASGSVEGLFEPGSNDTVLANKLSIIDENQMGNFELDKLLIAQQHILDDINDGECISSKHLCQWHKRWLGDIYLWAGKYRSVNMSKGDFHFAAAHLVQELMCEFEEEYLSKFTPSTFINERKLIDELAIVHVEFILIHPFRDGNGRLGRLLMTIMALQAGLPILKFEHIDENKEYYFKAIQAGLGGNYDPMRNIVSSVLKASLLND